MNEDWPSHAMYLGMYMLGVFLLAMTAPASVDSIWIGVGVFVLGCFLGFFGAIVIFDEGETSYWIGAGWTLFWGGLIAVSTVLSSLNLAFGGGEAVGWGYAIYTIVVGAFLLIYGVSLVWEKRYSIRVGRRRAMEYAATGKVADGDAPSAPAPTPVEGDGGSAPVAILGTSGSGKTVFMASLSIVLGRGDVRGMSSEIVKGLGYQRAIRQSLETPQWPDHTPVGQFSTFTLRIFKKRRIGEQTLLLEMNDISGEDFESTFSASKDEIELPEALENIPHAGGFIWLIDPDTFDRDHWVYHDLMRYLIDQRRLGVKGRLEEPIAVVFTKSDRPGYVVDDPKDYFARHASELEMTMGRRVRRREFFKIAATVQDEDGLPRVPFTQQGVIEVLDWMMERIR